LERLCKALQMKRSEREVVDDMRKKRHPLKGTKKKALPRQKANEKGRFNGNSTRAKEEWKSGRSKAKGRRSNLGRGN